MSSRAKWTIQKLKSASHEGATSSKAQSLRVVVALVAVLAVVAAGVVATLTLRPRPLVQTVLQAPVGGDMQVVVLQLSRRTRLDKATLFLSNGDAVGAATPNGPTDAVAFFVPREEGFDRIEIEADGKLVLTDGP